MRKISLLFMALFMVLAANVKAQDEDYVTDENLRRYAIMMESVDAMKSEISAVTNQMIRDQEGMDGKRYLELSKGEGDAAKEYEQKFMDAVNKMQEDRKEDIGTVIQILATKMLPDGGKAYKAIKSAISSDEAVKTRYKAILAKIQATPEGNA